MSPAQSSAEAELAFDIIDLLAMLVGAFYALGGWLAVRATATDHVLDRALAALSRAEEGIDRTQEARRRWLCLVVVLSGASGIALLVLSAWAVPLFVAGLLAQLAWLMGAHRALSPIDEDGAVARRRSGNAALIYGATTLFVCWLFSAGRLAPAADPMRGIVVLLGLAGFAAYLWRALRWRPTETRQHAVAIRAPIRFRFEVVPDLWPLVDADTGGRHSHFKLLPIDLALRIEQWHDDYSALASAAPPGASSIFASDGEERRFRAEAAKLVADAREVLGPDTIEGPVYTLASFAPPAW